MTANFILFRMARAPEVMVIVVLVVVLVIVIIMALLVVLFTAPAELPYKVTVFVIDTFALMAAP
jgi:hypothetical protein